MVDEEEEVEEDLLRGSPIWSSNVPTIILEKTK